MAADHGDNLFLEAMDVPISAARFVQGFKDWMDGKITLSQLVLLKNDAVNELDQFEDKVKEEFKTQAEVFCLNWQPKAYENSITMARS